jgi:hypothetical protein
VEEIGTVGGKEGVGEKGKEKEGREKRKEKIGQQKAKWNKRGLNKLKFEQSGKMR